MPENDIQHIFEIIETALTDNGYHVIDGDKSSAILRNPGTGCDFELQITPVE